MEVKIVDVKHKEMMGGAGSNLKRDAATALTGLPAFKDMDKRRGRLMAT